MEFLEVDGSQGEGGGQILRSAVSFAAILRRPVRVVKIRAGRASPGLKTQHISSLEVLSRVFDGRLTGATPGSSTITFVPGSPGTTSLSIDMGTAASITLVLQAVIPAVALSGSKLTLDLIGGTDVPWSPTLDYFRRVVRPACDSIGVVFDVRPTRRGYYPRGGGSVSASIEPSDGLRPLDKTEKNDVRTASVISRCAGLPRHVAERQLGSASESLRQSGFTVEEELVEEQADSPGSSVLVSHVGKGCALGGDGIGARGKRAEEVGKEAAMRFLAAARSGAAIDSNLADMIVPLLSLAPGASRVRIPNVTEHLRSGMVLASLFTGSEWSVEDEGPSVVVSVSPR